LFEEGDAIPSMLDWHLWQEQTSTAILRDQQSVASHFNPVRSDWLQWRQDAQRDFQQGSFVFCDWQKADILES
jgi:hypothetical protein